MRHTLRVGTVPQRTTNGRIIGYIAAATLVLTAIVVVVVPPMATRLTGPPAESRRADGGWVPLAEGAARPVPMPPLGVVNSAPQGPALPPPGEQQPEDPEASRAEVEEALKTLFSGTNPREVRLTALDDPSNLDDAMDAVRERYPEASDTSEPEMAELVFTDASTASFLFRLRYVGAPLLPARIGTARLVDGRWMITRSTLCEVLSAAGSTCDAPAPPPT